eukprot:COSAG04_NODE_299_length_17462_cov_3.686057_15_plen_339_part_00
MVTTLATRQPRKGAKLHVNRLARTVRAAAVREKFVPFATRGELYVKILCYEDGSSKGSAFVEFADRDDALDALAALGAPAVSGTPPSSAAEPPSRTASAPVAPAPAAKVPAPVDSAPVDSTPVTTKPITLTPTPAEAASAYVPPHLRRSLSDDAANRVRPQRLHFHGATEAPRAAKNTNSPVFDSVDEPGAAAKSPPLSSRTTASTPVSPLFLSPSKASADAKPQQEKAAAGQSSAPTTGGGQRPGPARTSSLVELLAAAGSEQYRSRCASGGRVATSAEQNTPRKPVTTLAPLPEPSTPERRLDSPPPPLVSPSPHTCTRVRFASTASFLSPLLLMA